VIAGTNLNEKSYHGDGATKEIRNGALQ